LCDKFKNSRYPLPENIRIGRNKAIKLGFLEVILSISSLSFYVEERSRLILALIILAFFSSFAGLYAKVSLSYFGLLAHSMFTISIIGGFYIYIIITYFIDYYSGN
jgi:hypothetical protein